MHGNNAKSSRGTVVPAIFVIKHYMEMLKLHLCLYVAFSAVFGHAMASQHLGFEAVVIGWFVLILACGAAVLNNIQDREYDGFFLRTCHRSLPQKKVPVHQAGIMAAIMITAGLAGLLATGVRPFFWGLVAVIAQLFISVKILKLRIV